MTEQKWMTSEDPAAMLGYLFPPNKATPGLAKQFRPSNRKLRLFTCAVARACGFPPESISVVERCVEVGQPDHNFNDQNAIDRGEFWRRCKSIDAAHSAVFRCRKPEMANLLREIVGNPFCPVAYSTVCREWLTPTVLKLAQLAYDERQYDGALDPLRLMVLADALEEAGCTDEAILRHLRGWWFKPHDRCHYCKGSGIDYKKLNRPHVRYMVPPRCMHCQAGEVANTGGWQPLPGPHVRGCWVLDLLLGRN